jgi:hypothetical protein
MPMMHNDKLQELIDNAERSISRFSSGDVSLDTVEKHMISVKTALITNKFGASMEDLKAALKRFTFNANFAIDSDFRPFSDAQKQVLKGHLAKLPAESELGVTAQ